MIPTEPVGSIPRPLYPPEPPAGYSREEFIDDLLREHETEVRRCLQQGAHKMQIDFTEGRLAMKIDPSGDLLTSFIDLNNFHIPLAGEPDPVHVLKIIREYMKPDQRIFIGVISPIDPRIETPQVVRDRILIRARALGTRLAERLIQGGG